MFQVRSIQALQQATLILSEVTGSLPPAPEPRSEEVTADFGNSFGEASYGGREPLVRFAQCLPPGHGGPRNMSKVKSGDRRHVSKASTYRNEGAAEQSQVGQCEIDSHADTCCLGLKFVPIYFTGKVCGVALFLVSLPIKKGSRFVQVLLSSIMLMVEPISL